MPYKRHTPEQIAFAREKQREYNRHYRQSAKGKATHRAGQTRYYEAHRDELNDAKRSACEVCGGPKEPGRGFRKCNDCWGVRRAKDLAELIAEQGAEMQLDRMAFVPPQRFGDSTAPNSTVLPLEFSNYHNDRLGMKAGDHRDLDYGGTVDPWDDPTANEALG